MATRQQTVSSRPFAGRIGGNQEFVAAPGDEKAEEILKQQPDAAPLLSIQDAIDPSGFLVYDTWRQAFIEGWATYLLVMISGAASNGLVVTGQSPIVASLYAALVNWIALSLFILSAAPASGGHLKLVKVSTTLLMPCAEHDHPQSYHYNGNLLRRAVDVTSYRSLHYSSIYRSYRRWLLASSCPW